MADPETPRLQRNTWTEMGLCSSFFPPQSFRITTVRQTDGRTDGLTYGLTDGRQTDRKTIGRGGQVSRQPGRTQTGRQTDK